MEHTLQSALARLIGALDAATGGRCQAIVRSGRFACATDGLADCAAIPANALDALTGPTDASQAPSPHLVALCTAVGGGLGDVRLWPVRDAAGVTVAALCVPAAANDVATEAVIATVAQTLAVLIDTLEAAAGHAATAQHDPLTHLPGRGLFAERLADELAATHRGQGRVGVLVIDLDDFAAVNETHGKAVGDRVLQRVASRLHHAVRRNDFLARTGEDEFALVAVALGDQPEGAHVAQRLLQVISQPIEIEGASVTPAASIGIAVCPHDGSAAASLLQSATIAMHRAKMRGHNQFEYCTPQMNADAMERLELEGRLRLAIEKRQLSLVYQPIVNKEGRVNGVEALLRWQHPERGSISPVKFIPIAEQTGLILPIGTWVLRNACQQAAQWRLENRPVPVNVNVSALQFAADDFEQVVEAALADTGLPAHLLELELTESAMGEGSAELAAKLKRLRGEGIRIAIDDFGAGYSNLSRLHSFPIDTIKIDRAFINEIGEKESATPLHHRTAVLRAIGTLGHSLGLKLVAEGVETEGQAAYLRRIGYDALQGFLFARPMPAGEAAAFIDANGLAPRPGPMRIGEAA
ncbi:MAG TPA: EAL domain-containing protein [Tepidisphaeraceae bacterium]|jgi:diguanylate cyclase (GGDEF)-like protein